MYILQIHVRLFIQSSTIFKSFIEIVYWVVTHSFWDPKGSRKGFLWPHENLCFWKSLNSDQNDCKETRIHFIVYNELSTSLLCKFSWCLDNICYIDHKIELWIYLRKTFEAYGSIYFLLIFSTIYFLQYPFKDTPHDKRNVDRGFPLNFLFPYFF